MKQTINIAAYGWRHDHWLTSFYPEDLPEDWQLSYYSNEFNAAMVPSSYWSEKGNAAVDCEQWLDDVHEGFKFYIECQADMFDYLSEDEVIAQLRKLQPQLAELVYEGEDSALSESLKSQFMKLAAVLDVEIVGIELSSSRKAVWRESDEAGLFYANIACIENELTDLRAVRVLFERFINRLGLGQCQDGVGHRNEACIFVQHEQLQTENIKNARSVLEIMGY